MTNPRKVVVIGAGHNGLVCATYLAKSGYEVKVLEARPDVGGCAAMREFGNGFKAPMSHVPYGLNAQICKDLGLTKSRSGKSRPTIALSQDGGHLHLEYDTADGASLSPADKAAYAAFKKEFHAYAAALEPMMMTKPPRLKDMDNADKLTLAKLGWKLRFGLGTDPMREFFRVGGINIFDVLNEQFENEQLKGAISVDAVLGQHMGPRTPTTVLTYLHRLRSELNASEALDAGSPLDIAGDLKRAAESSGVSILTNTRVDRIEISDSRVSGVALTSGEVIAADIVVSNADAKSTFLNLIDTSELDAMLVHRVHKTRNNGNVAKLHLGLSELPQIEGLTEDQLRHRLLVAPSMKYVEHAFNHAKYGEFSESPVLEITFPSLLDPALAPAGQHVMSIAVSFAPYKLKQGWESAKPAFADHVVRHLEAYVPNLSSKILASELLTPIDIEREYNVTGGHWHHGELSIDQSFMMRPVHGAAQYDTPIDELFLCGAAAHPGGGVNGAPGHNAAKRILSLRGQGK